MRKVRLLSAVKTDVPYICGDKDQELRLADYVATFVVLHKLAVYTDEEPVPGPSRAELEAQEAALKLKEADADVREEKAEEGLKDEVKRPYGNAPKSAWVRYAVAVDDKMTEERATDMTKADLMSKFGERL
jgi:hypothetical protein